MALKDYYKTLGISPVATALQVKKSFRRLALQYHPDKNEGNALAAAKFSEIQEAYEILADAAKREEYNYKRWYSRSINEVFKNEPLTPADILAECKSLTRYMQSVSAMRINYDGLSHHIRQLLNDSNVAILQQCDDQTANQQVIAQLLQPASVLPYKYIPPITSLLLRVAGSNPALKEQVLHFDHLQKQQDNWQQYRLVLVLLLTALICWIIYSVSK